MTTTAAASAAYRRSSVDTAAPVRLIVMLHDGLLAALDRAETALRIDDRETVHTELTRAQAIVLELWSALDPAGADVTANLTSLYEYAHRQLVTANVRKDFAPAEPVRLVFTELREAWRGVEDDVARSAGA